MTIFTNDERLNDFIESIRLAVRGETNKIWKILPVVLQSGDGHTAVLQSAVSGVVMAPDGTISNPALPLLLDAPIHFPGGGGVTSTHPTNSGDEGIAVFTDRAQDTPHQSGGVNNDPIDDRAHHLSDSRYIPGGRSDPRKLSPAPSSSSGQHRSDDGNHVSDLHPTNGISHASTAKVANIAGGAAGAGTAHLPGSIIKNAPRVMINTATIDGFPQPGMTIANSQAVQGAPLPVSGPMASAMSSAMSAIAAVAASSGVSAAMASTFTDPTTAANSSLSGAVSSGASALTGALGGAAATMVAAMTGGGGLNAALTTLAAGTGPLSGSAQPSGGAFGLADVMSHAAMLDQFFGPSPPSPLAISNITAPLQCSPTLAAMQTSLASTVAAVIAGSMTVAAGTSAVVAMNATISALMTNANAALSGLQTAAPALSNALAAATAFQSPSATTQAVTSVLAPTMAMTGLAAAAAAIIALTSGEMAAMTSFPDSSATRAGATGGM